MKILNSVFPASLALILFVGIVPDRSVAEPTEIEPETLPASTDEPGVRGDLSLETLANKTAVYAESLDRIVEADGVDLAKAQGTHLRVELENRCAEVQSKSSNENASIEDTCENAREKLDQAMNSLPE